MLNYLHFNNPQSLCGSKYSVPNAYEMFVVLSFKNQEQMIFMTR